MRILGRDRDALRRLVDRLVAEGERPVVAGRDRDVGPLDDAPAVGPQAAAGAHLRGSLRAIAQLEAQRARGASRLVLVDDRRSAAPGLRIHVEGRYAPLHSTGGWTVHDLRGGWRSAEHAFDDVLEAYRWRLGIRSPSILDWTGTMRIRPRITDPPVRDDRPLAAARNTVIFGPPSPAVALDHADGAIHLVVLGPDPDAETLREAERVARDAVVIWPGAAGERPEVRWRRQVPETSVRASIIIRGTDRAAVDSCLRALDETTPTAHGIEVILATLDDGVADVAGAWSDRLPLTCIRGATAAATATARGEHLVFLAEDVITLPGWLGPLLDTLADNPRIGVTGGRVVAPDGRIAHAGGILFDDARAVSFGRGTADPDAPLFGDRRTVDHVTGAALATAATLFRSLGGLDALIDEDFRHPDYCLRVRAAGLDVVHVPQSVVVGSPGDPRADGAGHERFARRWAARLARQPSAPAHLDDAAWQRLARQP